MKSNGFYPDYIACSEISKIDDIPK